MHNSTVASLLRLVCFSVVVLFVIAVLLMARSFVALLSHFDVRDTC